MSHKYNVIMTKGRVSYAVFNDNRDVLKTKGVSLIDISLWQSLFLSEPKQQELILRLAHTWAKEDVRQLDKYLKS